MGGERTALLIATVDTKGAEALFLKTRLEGAGIRVMLMNPSILQGSPIPVDISPDQIAAAGGHKLSDIRALGHEGKALAAMTEGAVASALALWEQGAFQGVIGLGGSMGSTLSSAVMRALPIGVPKVLISTMASGFVRPFVGAKDILMLHSVVDLNGLNRVTRRVLANGAAALAGMLTQGGMEEEPDKPLALISTLGTTDACAVAVRHELELQGFEAITFHTNGMGGAVMDQMVRDLDVAVVVDLSLIEVSENLFGGLFDAGPDRSRAAPETGVPLVAVPGNIDFLVAGPLADAEHRFPGKRYHRHNAAVTAVRAGPEEFRRTARHLAGIWNEAKGPVRVFVPIKGFSAHDSEQGNLYEPTYPPYFAEALRGALNEKTPMTVERLHINDPAFAAKISKAAIEIARRPAR